MLLCSSKLGVYRPQTLRIGFGHKARHGKDYIAQYVHEQIPEATKIYPLSLPMKYLSDCLFNLPEKKPGVLQALGTDVGRAANPNYWIEKTDHQIIQDSPPVALIPDIRFYNEAQYIQSNGGFLVHVKRLNEDGTPYISPDRPSNHQSEIDMETFRHWNDVIVAKSGDTETLEREAERVVSLIRKWLAETPEVDKQRHPNFPRAYKNWGGKPK